ncbi:unnamed protein product, partial [Sphacelaria rigidula]
MRPGSRSATAVSPKSGGAGGVRGGGGGGDVDIEDDFVRPCRTGSNSSIGSIGSITDRIGRPVVGSNQSLSSSGDIIRLQHQHQQQTTGTMADKERRGYFHHHQYPDDEVDGYDEYPDDSNRGGRGGAGDASGVGGSSGGGGGGGGGGRSGIDRDTRGTLAGSTRPQRLLSSSSSSSVAAATRRSVPPAPSVPTSKNRTGTGGEKLYPIEGLGPALEPRRPRPSPGSIAGPQPWAGQGMKTRRGGD